MKRRYDLTRSDNFPKTQNITKILSGSGSFKVTTGFPTSAAIISNIRTYFAPSTTNVFLYSKEYDIEGEGPMSFAFTPPSPVIVNQIELLFSRHPSVLRDFYIKGVIQSNSVVLINEVSSLTKRVLLADTPYILNSDDILYFFADYAASTKSSSSLYSTSSSSSSSISSASSSSLSSSSISSSSLSSFSVSSSSSFSVSSLSSTSNVSSVSSSSQSSLSSSSSASSSTNSSKSSLSSSSSVSSNSSFSSSSTSSINSSSSISTSAISTISSLSSISSSSVSSSNGSSSSVSSASSSSVSSSSISSSSQSSLSSLSSFSSVSSHSSSSTGNFRVLCKIYYTPISVLEESHLFDEFNTPSKLYVASYNSDGFTVNYVNIPQNTVIEFGYFAV